MEEQAAIGATDDGGLHRLILYSVWGNFSPIETLLLVIGRLNDITLRESYDLKDQIDEGKPREHVLAAIGRKQGD